MDECCVREIKGYNCALGLFTTMRYCYTANIGGEISYATIDGFYVDSALYKEFLDDFDKEAIPNKPCDIIKYEEVKDLVGVVQ